jgi:hypothetical protein
MTKKQRQRIRFIEDHARVLMHLFNRFAPRYRTANDALTESDPIFFDQDGYEKAEYEVRLIHRSEIRS